MKIVVPVAALLSLAALLPSMQTIARSPYPLLQIAVTVQRSAVLAILVFAAAIEVILFWYPLNLSRNTVLYCAGYLVFFTAQTAGLSLIAQLGVSVTARAGILMQTASCLCLLFWAFTLSKAGERRDIVVGASWRPGEQERMLEQLRQLNAALFRVAKYGKK